MTMTQELDPSEPSVDATTLTPPGTGPAEISPGTIGRDGVLTVSAMGSLLDADHLPATNGRMAICRRCGAHTDGPEGRQHVPGLRRLARYDDWLRAQSRTRHVARANALVSR
jgi:hypothetical protein